MFKRRFKSHHDVLNAYSNLLQSERSSMEELEVYLNVECEPVENAIYIHVPFCDKICSFCNLNRRQTNEDKTNYVDFLIKQIKWYGQLPYFNSQQISAVYFGGGTPTTIKASDFKSIITALRSSFNISSDAEITCETTLHNLKEEHILAFNEIGINRMSIGIQTFNERGRKLLNRTYSESEITQRIKNTKAKFNGEISIDIIYNYPNQTKAMLDADVNKIIELDIASVSFYSLMFHKGSKLSEIYNEASMSDKLDNEFHNHFVERLLTNNTYELLEITKIADKKRDQYKYMKIRNKNGNTIPIGCGAGGQIDEFGIYNLNEERTMVSKSIDPLKKKCNEIYGAFQSLNIKITSDVYQEIKGLKKFEQFVNEGLILVGGEKIHLSKDGLFYANNISAEIIKEYLENKKRCEDE